jgi:hypothetical protein
MYCIVSYHSFRSSTPARDPGERAIVRECQLAGGAVRELLGRERYDECKQIDAKAAGFPAWLFIAPSLHEFFVDWSEARIWSRTGVCLICGAHFPKRRFGPVPRPADSRVARDYGELPMARQYSCRAQVITLHALYSLTSVAELRFGSC